MNYGTIKFKFGFDSLGDDNQIEDILNKAGNLLNFQFDKDFNVFFADSNVNYQFRDVSNLTSDEIEKIADSFFDFTFDDICNVFLYKFLVLKNNEKFTLLAIVHPSIFNYSSINDFYDLFDDLNNDAPENNLSLHYGNVKDYLNSPDFNSDSFYWRNFILNASDYIKFYNLKSDDYRSQKIEVDGSSVRDFIENQGCTPFNFYASVFSLYLSRIDRLDGCLLNTNIQSKSDDFNVFNRTILKVDFNSDSSFADYLNQLGSAYDDAVSHTKVSIENFLDENLSYYSVYDLSDLNENVSVYNGYGFALTLNIYGDYLELVYNSDLFPDAYIEHMAGNIGSLIDNILNSSGQLIGDIIILSDVEKDLISDFCKGQTVEVDKDRIFGEAFREHAKANPDAIAVDDGVNKITYGELERSSNSLANDLYENYGIGPGSRVALMLPRNYHFPEFILALSKIGAAYVPIDLLFPANRIGHMLFMAGVNNLITTEEIGQTLDLNVNIIHIEDLKYDDDVDVEILSKKDDLFAILFTSGTTGLPKGVMFYYKQFPWGGAAFEKMFNFTPGDVVGSYFSFSFVASFVICISMYLGGCVRIFNENEQKNSLLLIKALKETPMNSLILPPAVGIPIFENEDLQLDYLVLAGAKLNELSKKDRHTKLVNFYGTTEIIFAVSKIYDLKDIEDNRVPIGRPVSNTWAYILDGNGNQMPVGVPGEICIAGGMICDGYYNNAETTSEAFVDNPFCDNEINEKMYRTGDIGFYNFDGEIEIIGREDDQLSVRGFRIESNEILEVMNRFDEISDIYLDVDYDNLIAYYTTDGDLDIEVVKEALKNEVPYYMVPSLFIELDEIPLNINGKIDRSSLKRSMADDNVEIADDILRCVVDAFKEVLNLDSVLIDDDFVSLGGNSLSAMKLQLLLKERLNVYLSSNELIDISTPQEVANYIKYNLNVHSAVDEDKYTFDEPCPLSESQLNVYLDESVNDMGTAYSNSFKIDYKNNYSVDEIKHALIKLFDVFPVLKARVLNDDGDLSFVFDGEPEITEGTITDIKSFVRPFDFDKYLSRFLIVEDDASVVLCADFHHLIFDGTSMNVVLKKLSSFLNNESVDFVDNGVLRQLAYEEAVDSSYMDDAKEFYDGMLADADDVHDLLPSVDGDDNESEFIDTFDMDMESLSSFLQSHSITYNQFFTSVFGYALSRFSGSEKVLFNIVEDGRGHIELSESVGMFVKTLPVLMDCKNQEIDSFLKYSSNLVNSVMRYDLYPFRLLAREYDLNSNVLFQYSHDLFSDVINEDLKYSIDDLPHDINSNLSFNILNNGENRLTIRVLYSSLFSKSFIEHFVESYKLILNGIMDADELKDINYLSDGDAELLDNYNQTEHLLDYSDVLDAFNDNLSKCPNNKLVSMNDVSYSYAEGAFIADWIAKQLIDFGVNPGGCVGFLTERSENYMFCALGILSMGGVYVPLDDALPDERIEFMIEDADAKVVIATDETYERVKSLNNDVVILNISDIVNGELGTLNKLDVCHGDVAGILYTSGSTGIPKGVRITRNAILNVAAYYADTYNLNDSDVYALYPSIGFDAGCESLFKAIYAGACLCVVPQEIRLNMSELNEYFIDQNVTHTMITTQVGKLFMDMVDETSLDYLFLGGEKLGDVESPEGYILIDEFGPTETNNFITSINNSDKIHPSSVGYLNYNSKAYILDSEARQVPFGAVGELYLAGDQVSEGYLNREDENSKSFIDNPFDDNEKYSRLYRTGDMVRILHDGSLSIIGRRDGQVKVRGNRVELSEIESVIREMNHVEDVTVQTIKNNGNNELVAYIVVSDDMGDEDLKDSVCDYVGEHKPDYMVPSFVMKLDSIPLTVNDKVDKSALPDVDLSSLQTEYVAPTNETEKHIVDAFEVVFNQKGIGLNDDFVRLGGDSITAIRVISLLERNDISCSARDILNYKTPYLIAQNVEKVTKISYDATEGEVDLLPVQSYFFDQINDNEFSQDFILKSKVDLDLDILQRAFDELTNVHDMLRATYRHDGDKVVQEILPLNSSVCEIEEYDADNLNNALENSIKESRRALDIGNGLIKICLIHCGDECYVTFVIHHLIIDGVSWSSLIDDLTYIYTQLENAEEINVLRPYPFKSWVEDVRSLADDISDDEKQYWIKVNGLLDDSTIHGKSKGFTFNAEASFDIDNLLMLSEEEYLALSIARAYKKTYDEDIIFDRESYGRDEGLADVSRTVGWFTSHFPVVVDVNNEYDAVSLMNDVYSIKESFKDVEHLGLNYGSLIYTSHELEYKHCPVTFNFLSSEFSFKNEMFESINQYVPSDDEMEVFDLDFDSFGITFNVVHQGSSYNILGNYADNTYIGDKFEMFVENIKYELDFIANFNFKDNNVVCCLSEAQLGIYLDEKVNEKGTAYSNPRKFQCDSRYSVDEIKDAIHALIEKHPVIMGRVLDTDNIPLLICDSYPSIEVVNNVNNSNLDKPFELDKSLARFVIEDNEEGKSIFYNIHHIINDATSRSIINRELEQALMGNLDDATDFGFAYASRDSFESKYDYKYDYAQKFFYDEFADIDEVQYLLSDVDGSEGSVGLPIKGIREKVELFTQENGITVSNLLNAVFAYTYSRFTGSNKVYYNFTEHGRHESYLQDAWGMYIRTIPVIVDCENKSVNDFVVSMSDLILESMAHSSYPFRLLAREFNLNNDVLFEYNYNLNDFGMSDDIVVRDYADGVSDFLCVVNDLDDGFVVTVSHLDKISQHTAEQFVKVFKEILIQFLEKEELGDINYISDDDIGILDTLNQTEHPLVYNDILDAFNDNLSKYPENKLVEYNDVTYTYAECAFVADVLGKKLVDLGVNAQDKVSFLVPRSELYMFCVLGVMSVGGIYVPLDEALPNDRIDFMIKDTESKVLIVSDETYDRGIDLAEDCTILNVSEIIKNEIKSLDSLDISYGDLACILYTSGSTGLPKGVKITRKSILNFIDFHVNDLDILRGDVYGLFASIGFDVAMAAIFSAMYSGGCVNVIPEDIRLNIKALNNHFVKYGVTHSYITTQVAKLFIQEIESSSLKVLIAGGEKLGEINETRNYRIVDAYGPTEACVYVISAATVDKIDSSSVGYVQNNTKAYILDDEFRRVPIGGIGELYLSGCQLADGYLNRPEENAKAFMDNPFEEDSDYDKLYRTGDMARFLPDRTYGIVGRRDGQVKIRGNRVELSEIEVIIREIDYVDDVTVKTIENASNIELVAYVVLSNAMDENDFEEDIRDYVREHKPEYMVPSFVIGLDEIPLNVNGKVDKRALPSVDLSSLHAEYVAPTTEDEKTVVEAFEKVFNQEIGIHDDFVHLGGDSLTAIKMVSYLEGYNITVADILTLRTPYAIAQNIKQVEWDLDIYNLESGCPLNEPQLNVYLDMVVNNKYGAYLIPLFMEISKKYEVDEIFDALNRLFDVHPILGMCIGDEFEVPYLVKGSQPSIIVEDNVSEDFVIEFLNRPFDLQDSLCRFLIVTGNDNYQLFAAFNHIIFDALSGNVFKRDLQNILDGGSVDVDDSFLKVSAFSQQIQDTDEYVNAEKFYESMLLDNEGSTDLIESVDAGEQGQLKLDLEINNDLLKSFLVDHGVSENVLFTGAFAYTLSRFTGYENTSFNIIENGRDRFNNFNSIGMYVNTLPVLADCKNQSIFSFMEYMAGLIYDVMRYNYYPYRLLANEYDINSDILFQFLPEGIGGAETNENISNSEENDMFAQRDNLVANFSVEVIQRGKDYNLNVRHCDKYSNTFVERFAESYKLILHQFIDVDKLDEINYVTDEDIEILDALNQTEYPLAHDDILDAFNDNLSKYPDNKLVSFNDKSYSYAESAFIADKIAKSLKDYGVETGDAVSFLVERSERYMFAVLGILSVGAVYVPLDDAHPDDRIEFMMEDTDSKVVIVDDYTLKRVKSFSNNVKILNISDFPKGDIGSLPNLPIAYGDLACILYTSGSTGLPKGVKITRKSILNFIDFHVNDLDILKGDVYGLFASIGFDVAMAALFSAMYTGSCVNIIPEDIRLNIKALNNHFVKYGITHSYITTQVAKLFIQDIESTSLKVLIAGGEKLGEINETRHYKIVDAYGPTEACVYVISANTTNKIDSSSVGYVQNNTKAYILDDEFRRVPIGAIGELYLSGCQLADGYLNRPEENAKAFMDNPFEENSDYSKLYRTGDMVRLLPDKTYGIVGRRDNQVKIRGNRVELSEIEVTIREIDYVDDVTVKTTKNGSNNELVAYVVANGIDEELLKDNIQNYVHEHKPEYMVPSFVIKLDEIPLNVNGKVDKRALPDIDLNSLHAEYVAPRNENEKIIVEAFEKGLNIENVSIYDDFVRLGGDSLTGIKLLSYIDSGDVTMADIFAFRTPEAIAKNMSDLSFDLDLYSLESGCPLNAAQINVFADVNVYNKKNAYHIPGFIPIPKEYGLEKILDSLDELLDVHPILSMRLSDMYEANDTGGMSNLDVLKDLTGTAKKLGIGNIMNIIRSYGLNVGGLYNMLRTTIRLFKGEYPYIVKGDKPPITVESDVDENIIVDFFSESLDLYNYLSKFMIAESEDSYYLFYLIHHIIFDAISEGVLIHDLCVLLDGGSVKFDDAFLKTSAFTHQIKSTEKFDEAIEFYHPILSEAGDVGELVPDSSSEGYVKSSYDLEFDKVAFKSFLNKAGISEIVLFSSVFTYTLSQFVDGDKVLFTLIENGRDRFNEDFIGMTSNVMPLVADCKNRSINSFMEHMSHLVYGASRYSYYPILYLYQKYDFEVKVMFQFVPNWIADDIGSADTVEDINVEEISNQILNNYSDFLAELFVQIYQYGETYRIIITNSNRYSDKMMKDFRDTYISVLSNIINSDMSFNLSDTLK